MGTTVFEARVSPELALVCPELRAAAIAALPERDPDAMFALRPRARARAPEYRLLEAVASSTAEVETPTPLPTAILAYAAHRALAVAVEAAAVLAFVVGAFALAAALGS